MSEFQADQNPIFQHGTQFVFTFAQSCGKSNHAFARRNAPEKCAVFEFVIFGLRQSAIRDNRLKYIDRS